MNGSEETVLPGTLSQTVNEFVLPTNAILLDVIIEWSDVTPILNEMILSVNTEEEVGNKDNLKNLLNDREDTSDWTASSKASYDQAVANASKVNESARVPQETVNDAETQKGFAKTGDTASVAGWSVLLLFAAAVMIVLGKKMKKEEEI